MDIWNSRPQRQSSRRQSSPATDGPKDSRPISQRQSSHDDSRPERQFKYFIIDIIYNNIQYMSHSQLLQDFQSPPFRSKIMCITPV